MEGFFWDSFTAQREIVYSKLHFTYHTWKVYLSPWNFELRVNLFDSPSLISSTYHWFIEAIRHWKYYAVILMMPYFVEHNAVKIIFFPVKSVISLVLFSLVPIVGNNFFLNDWQIRQHEYECRQNMAIQSRVTIRSKLWKTWVMKYLMVKHVIE